MNWRMISYMGFHVVRRCIFTLTCIFKHHKKKPMKVKLFRPRVVGTHPKSQCFASQAATQGAFSQKDPGNHRHHQGPVGVGRMVVSSQKNGWVSNRNRPLFPGDPENFQGVNWLAVSFREGQIAKKNVFWVRPDHLKVCVIFQKLLWKCSFFWGALLVTPCYLIIRNVGALFWWGIWWWSPFW